MVTTPYESATDAMNKIDKVMTKVKHTAFRKVKIRKVKKSASDENTSNINEKLLEEQRKGV